MPSKRYKKALEQVDVLKTYPLKSAVEVLHKFPKAKFNETVDRTLKRHVPIAENFASYSAHVRAAMLQSKNPFDLAEFIVVSTDKSFCSSRGCIELARGDAIQLRRNIAQRRQCCTTDNRSQKSGNDQC